MRREMEEPVIGPGGMHDDHVETHPAYGMIGAARVSGSIGILNASDFRHQNSMVVRIKRSRIHRSLSRDWHSADEELIEVEMSESQWAAFISSPNIGDGVPCTLRRVAGETIPGIPNPPERAKQFSEEMMRTLREAERHALHLKKLIESGGKKSEMRDAMTMLINNLSPNVGFVAEQFGEHVEQTVDRAKQEVSAYILGAVTRAGLTALRAPVIELEDKDGGDGPR